MKTFLKKLVGASFAPRGLAMAALLVTGSVQTSHAASADPSAGGSFTWDLLSAGSGQRGIALLTFNSDHSFTGYQLLAAMPPKSNTNSLGSGRGDNTGRGDTGNNSDGKTNHFVFGFGQVTGSWQMNSRGQVVGFFSTPLNVTALVTNYHAVSTNVSLFNEQDPQVTTNININFANGQAVLITNFLWSTPAPHAQEYTFNNPNFTVDVGSAEETNTVFFTGKCVQNKRLDLVASTTFGKVSYKGKPAVQSGVDLTGSWIGTKRVNGTQTGEFFSLASSQANNPFPADFPDAANFPNIYFTTDGIGATYGFSGAVIFSQNKTVGFTFFKSDGTLSSTIGTLKAKKFGPEASATGIDEPLSRINFTATLQ